MPMHQPGLLTHVASQPTHESWSVGSPSTRTLTPDSPCFFMSCTASCRSRCVLACSTGEAGVTAELRRLPCGFWHATTQRLGAQMIQPHCCPLTARQP